MNTGRCLLAGLFCFLMLHLNAQPKTDTWLLQLLEKKGSSLLQKILAQPDTFQYQIIYTKIDRDKKNRPHFTHYYLNVDRNRYYNPASTVKLPTALAALEKLNRLKKEDIDKFTDLIIDSSYSGQSGVTVDTSSATGQPSLAQYIKKVFLVSDNDAYNRLYEFVGQEELNNTLHKKGYTDVRITRRFVPMTAEENRHTNRFRFMKKGKTVYIQQPAYSNFRFDFSRQQLIGRGHLDRNDSLVNAPMDFTTHNNLPLEDLNHILQSVMFPASVPKQQRFNLRKEDYQFLYQYMQALPSESRFPNYDTTEYFDSYTKFFFKANRQKIPAGIRIYNKTGWSYGFLTDAAYIKDSANGIEFMLAAVIYVNADGILNDNKYEYESIGYPFFAELFRVIHEYEIYRKKLKGLRDW